MVARRPGNKFLSASGGRPPGLYRSKLGAVQPTASRLTPEISLRFSVGPMQVIIENATDRNLDQLVKASGRRLKRAGYNCMPPYQTEVAGVVAGFGVQVFVLGRRTIINLEDARRLMDYVLVIPPS